MVWLFNTCPWAGFPKFPLSAAVANSEWQWFINVNLEDIFHNWIIILFFFKVCIFIPLLFKSGQDIFFLKSWCTHTGNRKGYSSETMFKHPFLRKNQNWNISIQFMPIRILHRTKKTKKKLKWCTIQCYLNILFFFLNHIVSLPHHWFLHNAKNKDANSDFLLYHLVKYIGWFITSPHHPDSSICFCTEHLSFRFALLYQQ